MEKNNFHEAIKGKQKDPKLMQEYMLSVVNSINNEISKIKEKYNNIYIYYKYNSESLLLNIFIVIYKNKNEHYKNNEITYLITLEEDYPKKPPMVFCLTDFYEKLDIFDGRNIQKNLIHNWKLNNNINDLIHELFSFSDILIYQSEEKLLPNIGEYHYNSYIYNINDFLLNNRNTFFRILYIKNNGELGTKDRYMIITSSKVLFFFSKNQKYKNYCILENKFELTWIDSVRYFSLQKYPNYTFFEFQWNNHSSFLNKFMFAIKDNKTNDSQIKDIIIDRKRYLLNNFKLFEKNNDNDVETIEKIINVKQHCLEKVYSKNIFYQIQKLYNNIINIFNSMNDEGYKIYVKKLQEFLTKFSKNKNIK